MSQMFDKAKKQFFDQEYSFSEILSMLWAYARNERKNLFLLFITLILNTAITIIVPLLISTAIDYLTFEGSIDFRTIHIYGWLFLIGNILTFIAFFFVVRAQWTIVARTVTRLRLDMFISLQKHDLSFYDRVKTGRIMSRVMDDTWELSTFMLIFVDLVINGAAIIIMVSILFSVEWRLTFGVLSIVPLIAFMMFVLGSLIVRLSRECQQTVAAVNGAMQESVAGIAISKSFSREAKNKKEFYDLNKDNLRANIKRSLTFASFFPIFEFLSHLIIFVIVFQGARYVIEGTITPGDLYLFYLYSLQLIGPLINFSQQIAQFQSGRAAAERIFSLIQVPSFMKTGSIITEDITGRIEFRNVVFGYSDTAILFDNVSVTIEAGQNIAIVGHTGSGKTSFISLLAHFYEIQKGEILVDDMNIRKMNVDDYRNHLGIVLQDPYLFSGTILDNIKYGNPTAIEKEIERAIEASHVKDFIEFLPEGLLTQVGERGSKLSLGQRQLVSLARALVANPKILVLDEATASVDAYTESLIQDALESLFKDRTSIVIAHRLSTVIGADRILVFQEGKIVGDGSHHELIENNLTYQELYKTYYEFQGVF